MISVPPHAEQEQPNPSYPIRYPNKTQRNATPSRHQPKSNENENETKTPSTSLLCSLTGMTSNVGKTNHQSNNAAHPN
jgi:hypothetical protein